MTAFKALDKFAYGALGQPHEPLRLVAVIGNYLNVAYFMDRTSDSRLMLPLSALVVAFTAVAHNNMQHAAGISTLWSFLYGFQAQHETLDHWLYWAPSAIMLVPWTFVDAQLYKLLGMHFWPWHPDFVPIAVGAHASFALFGALARTLVPQDT